MKFSLTKNKKVEFGITFYQIKAEEDGKSAKKGELGGWLEKTENLDMSGNAWVYDNARVYGNSMVYGNARVYGNSMVYGNAWVYGDSVVSGNARVSGDARVYGKLKLTLGYFFGMRYNNEEIKEFKQKEGEVILHKGESKIEFYNDDIKEETQDDIITLNGKKYKLVDNK